MPLTAPLLASTTLDRQIALEEKAVQDGIARYRRLASDAIKRGDGASLKPAERLLVHWFEPLTELIRDEQRAIAKGEPGVSRVIAGPVVRLLPPETLAYIVMHEVVSSCMGENGESKMVSLAANVGRAVFAELHMAQARRERRSVTAAVREGEMSEEDGRKERRRLDINQRFRRVTTKHVNWWAKKHLAETWKSRTAQVAVGALLIERLIAAASAGDYMDEKFDPAFRRVLVRKGGKTIAYLKMSDRAKKIIDDGHAMRQLLRPRYLPMLVRPYAWVDGAQGGYVSIRTPLISKPTPAQKEAIRKADMSEVYDGLDAVAGTGWRVHPVIHRVQLHMWQEGWGGMLGLPHRGDKAPPHKPENIDTDKEALKAWKREASAVYCENVQRASMRMEMESMLSIVDLFVGEEAFYFPHHLDYRGRAYCIPQHLNHQGDDVRRGVLEFAEAKPADTDEAMDHIRIEAANSWGNGKDKVSFDERIQWARDHEHAIRMAAKDPLSTDWWHGAEDPWQFLAACIALNDPEHAARLPVGRDGSCNGLQHYAALGRDAEGAAWVNMMPADRPRDVYTRVAEATRDILARTDDDRARLLLPLIDRKVVKQPVMTRGAYGATPIGITGQIATQLEEKGIDREQVYKLSQYLAGVVLEAIGTTCVAASTIMEWFRAGATAIAEAGHDVAWTNPIGMPVIQRARLWNYKHVHTILGYIDIADPSQPAPIDKRRQVNACPPNIIHSIDAAAMFLTAIACRNAGIAFAGVHDKFSTHAATRTQQDRILREQFVATHERYGLGTIFNEWRTRYPSVEIPTPPPLGDYDLKNVLISPFFFA